MIKNSNPYDYSHAKAHKGVDQGTDPTLKPSATAFRFAGFGRRLGAYFVDIILILIPIVSVFYFFLGFDETVSNYLNRDPGDDVARAEFLRERNIIRWIALMVYIIYCALLDGSSLQGSIGKMVFGIKVTDLDGRPLSYPQSVGRNAAKSLSFLPCGLG